MSKTNREIANSKVMQDAICDILHNRFGISSNLKEKVEDRDLFFGKNGLIHAREMTYLVYILEEEYGIKFGIQEYDDPRFYCLSGLSQIVIELIDGENHQKNER